MKYMKMSVAVELGDFLVECNEENAYALDIDNGMLYDARESVVISNEHFVALRDILDELILVLGLDKDS